MVRDSRLLMLFCVACSGGDLEVGPERPTCPHPQVAVDLVQYTQSLFSVAQSQDIVVTNDCTDGVDGTLTVSVPDGLGLSVLQQSVPLSAGESNVVTVVYEALSYAPVETVLQMTWGDTGSLTVPIQTEPAPDQDRDGYEAVEVGGTDCADQDASIYPNAPESENLVDDDCDGWVDETFVRQGEVYISEMMVLPKAVAMETGQWFELTNDASKARNIRGWELRASSGEVLLLPDLEIPSGARVTLAVDADPVKNGGITPDATYTYSDFPLRSNFGVLDLALDGRTIGYLEYDVSWPIGVGASIAADPVLVTDAVTATRGRWWCTSDTALPGGDRGTPGQINDYCRAIDHDGDGVSQNDGDCDDANAEISPDAQEIWDDVDNDCDGEIDRLVVEEARTSWMTGEANARLGDLGFVGVGDVDGDGFAEMVVNSRVDSGSYVGTAYVLNVDEYSTWRTTAARHSGSVVMGETGQAHNMFSPMMADNDGDGWDDLVLMGSGYTYTSTDYPGIAVFTSLVNGSQVKGRDADLYFSSDVYSYNSGIVMSDLDVNGDGVAEIIYGRQTYVSGVTGSLSIIDANGLASGLYDLTDSHLAEYTPNASYSVVGAGLGGGDWNADGYDDYVVRQSLVAMGYAGGGDDTLYGVLGEADPMGYADIDDVATIEIKGLGQSLNLREGAHSQLVDIDGSGSMDLVIPDASNGEVLVFFDVQNMEGSYTASDADVTIKGDKDLYGMQLSSGDFNGDGFQDIVLSGYDRSAGYYGMPTDGVVFVYNGADWLTSAPGEPSAVFTTPESNDLLGSGLLVYDFNGDGLDDLWIAASNAGGASGEASVMLRGGR